MAAGTLKWRCQASTAAAALWSAAARIAADGTGRFGPLTERLRRFLFAETPGTPQPTPSLHAAVGG